MKNKILKKKKVVKKAVKKKYVLPLMPEKDFKKADKITADMAALEEAFGKDEELVLFFLSWMKNDRNATKAYQEIKKGTSYEVASVMGCRLLRKVKNLGGVEILLESYKVGVDKYFKQLADGLDATVKKDVQIGFDDYGAVFSQVEEPDHKTRRHYHQALGRLLGFEGMDIQINNSNQNLNSNQNIIDNLQDDELDDLIN